MKVLHVKVLAQAAGMLSYNQSWSKPTQGGGLFYSGSHVNQGYQQAEKTKFPDFYLIKCQFSLTKKLLLKHLHE